MNFNIERVDNANTRVGGSTGAKRGQNFEVRFRKFNSEKGGKDSRFFISDKSWADLNLDTHGLRTVRIKQSADAPLSDVFLGVVTNDKAVLLKRTSKNEGGKKKGRNFKSTVLETDLAKLGVLNLDDSMDNKNQLLKVEIVSEMTPEQKKQAGFNEDSVVFRFTADTEGQAKEDSGENEAEIPTAPSPETAANVAPASDDNDL